MGDFNIRRKLITFLVAVICLGASGIVVGSEGGCSRFEEGTSARAPAADVYVDDDADAGWYDSLHVRTVQEGIDNATAGDTVFVYNGTYTENVVVDKTIDLVGENRNNTILDGGGNGDVVRLLVGNVNISGFTVRNGEKGIWGGEGAHNMCSRHVENTQIKNNRDGISMVTSTSNVISGNIITNNSDGIVLLLATNNNISGNTFSGNDYGIVLSNSNDNVISDNLLSKNSISLSIADNNIISGNIIRNSEFGISLAHSSNHNVLSGNTISSPSSFNRFGIYLSHSSNNTLTGNTISNSSYDGIQVAFSSNHNSLVGNAVHDSNRGISLYNTTGNIITENTASTNSNGVSLVLSDNTTVSSCNIVENQRYGIWLVDSRECFITENVFEDNVVHAWFVFNRLNFEGRQMIPHGNVWKRNHWDSWPSMLPHPIFGRIHLVPWLMFDWQPSACADDIL